MFVCICLGTSRHILLNIVLLQNCAIKNTGLTGNRGLGLEHSKALSVIDLLLLKGFCFADCFSSNPSLQLLAPNPQY